MTTTSSVEGKTTRTELVLTRLFDAPRDLVFQAWTDPARLALWWGPSGFTNPVCEVDLRPGGAIRIDMRGPDGTVYPMTGIYEEIVVPERLVFTAAALDAKGDPLLEVRNTVIFTQRSGKTQIVVRARMIRMSANGATYLDGQEAGWSQSLDRLAQLLRR
jgi:uncharacterized protein YndB with AHSA1/START domain